MTNRNLRDLYENKTALVATVGLQPQVITRSLDHFIFGGIAPAISELYLVHTAAMFRHPQWTTIESLKRYIEKMYAPMKVTLVPIVDPQTGDVVRDVETPDYAQETYIVLFNTIKQLKRDGYKLQGLLAGGRKSMTVYMMLSAQLIFDEADQLWHLFSAHETQEPHVLEAARGALQLPPLAGNNNSHLIDIPILHLAGLMPMVRELMLQSDDPTRVMQFYKKHESVEYLVRLRRFYEARQPLEKNILKLLCEGIISKEIAFELEESDTKISRRISKLANDFFDEFPMQEPNPRPKHVRLLLMEQFRKISPLD